MLGHHLLTFYRTLSRHRLYAAINVLGLAVGIAVFLVLFLDVRFETSFEQWIPNASQIYVIRTSSVGAMASLGGSYDSMGGLLEELRADYPRLLGARVRDFPGSVHQGAQVTAETVEAVDPTFFRVFELPLISGDGSILFRAPSDLVLTETKAKQYFGHINPLGRRITLAFAEGVKSYRVAGVLRDLPKNSELKFDFLVPLKVPASIDDPWWRHWRSTQLATYLRFKSPAEARALDERLDSFTDRHARRDLGPNAHETFRLRSHPLRFIHLHDGRDLSARDAVLVAALGTVGVLTLLLAAVNYVNLATARAGSRAREVAVRKVMGATQAALVVQFLSEAVFTAALSALLGVALGELALPWVNAAGGLSLKLDYLAEPALPLAVALIVLLIGLGAGGYPALILARFQAAAVLAAAKAPGGGAAGARVREALVVLQFTVAIAGMIVTGVVVAQTDYVRRAELGFRRDGMIVIDTFDGAQVTAAQRASLLAGWRALPGVKGAASSQIAPGFQDIRNSEDYKRRGESHYGPNLQEVSIGSDFFQTYAARLMAGRLPDVARGEDFIQPTEVGTSDAITPHAIQSVVLDRSALRALGFGSPQAAIGQIVVGSIDRPCRIIGVVDDLRFLSPHTPSNGTVFRSELKDFYSAAAGVRYAGSDPQSAMHQVEAIWRKVAPDAPFQAKTVEQSLDSYYAKDDHQAHLFTLAAVLAVLIGCVGLYGLASFSTARRVQEMGIRKTLGASTADILRLLVGQFLRPVLLANIVAWPLAYLAMRAYLGGFEQRIALSPQYFLSATTLALLIAVATVAGQAWSVARAEPAKALRHD